MVKKLAKESCPSNTKNCYYSDVSTVNGLLYSMLEHANPHVLFPVKMHAVWKKHHDLSLSEHLRDWLLEPSSLTARLKKNCTKFHVEVLGQRIEACSLDEATKEVSAGQEVLVREVVLHCDDKPFVFARSLLPLTSLTGEQSQLGRLGEQPLGQVIFNHPNLQRKSIEVAEFDQYSSVAQLAKSYQLSFMDVLWGRRSIFVIDNKPLIVAEVFLPESIAYQEKVNG